MIKTCILFYTLLSVFSLAQIKKIEIIKCQEIAVITQGAYDMYSEKCPNDNYRFTFRDMSYSHITVAQSFEFKDIDNAFDNLFNVIIDGFTTMPKDEIAFDLPNHYLLITYMSAFGAKGVSFFVKNKSTGISGKSNYFTKNQIYKLFGKKKK